MVLAIQKAYSLCGLSLDMANVHCVLMISDVLFTGLGVVFVILRLLWFQILSNNLTLWGGKELIIIQRRHAVI